MAVLGNERVDKATSHLNYVSPQLLPTKTDLTLFIMQVITTHWYEHSRNQSPNDILARIKPYPIPWTSSNQPFRHHEIIITRPRIDHIRLTHVDICTHLYRLPCEHCTQEAPLSVNHIFTCPALTPNRTYCQIPFSYTETLSKNLSSFPDTLPYLQSANFLSRIQIIPPVKRIALV